MDKLNGVWVIWARDSFWMLIDVHELIGCHLHHEPTSLSLRGFYLLRVVMVLFCSNERLEYQINVFSLLSWKSCRVYFLQCWLWDVGYILQQKLIFWLKRISVVHSQDTFYARGYLCYYFVLCFFLALICNFSLRWGCKIEVLYRHKTESGQEIRVDSMTRAIFSVESLTYGTQTKEFDVFR